MKFPVAVCQLNHLHQRKCCDRCRKRCPLLVFWLPENYFPVLFVKILICNIILCERPVIRKYVQLCDTVQGSFCKFLGVPARFSFCGKWKGCLQLGTLVCCCVTAFEHAEAWLDFNCTTRYC